MEDYMTTYNKKNKSLMLAALLLFVASLTTACDSKSGKVDTQVQLVNVDVYRGVDAKPNGKAVLSPSQFRFNPTLSTFRLPTDAPVQKPCQVRFVITGLPNSPPVAGDSGAVQNLAGYTATFDNNPAGHWSIQQPGGVSADDAKTAVSNYAKTVPNVISPDECDN